MALIEVKGDLLESDCDVIAHQCNCFKTMGAGIARQIKKRYPEAYKADTELPLSAEERLGKISVAHHPGENRYIVNLYGQYNYSGPGPLTDYPKLESSLQEMFRYFQNQPDFDRLKFGVPYMIGCGLAGGDWNIVSEMLERVSKQFGKDIYAYRLN
ncbi:MAG: macro domain-containing protein [Bacillaceae bacterium]|nr:macro domain-containing protein [Bacillaceae bacterium]